MKNLINPPDIAVALCYDGENAPRITATGKNETAAQILEIARIENIPIETDPELAKLLSQIPLGDEIPPTLYNAVAEVIAFAYWLSGKHV